VPVTYLTRRTDEAPRLGASRRRGRALRSTVHWACDAEIDRPEARHGEALASQMIGEPLGQGCVSLVTRDVMGEDSDPPAGGADCLSDVDTPLATRISCAR
jgi:hypothetical protein